MNKVLIIGPDFFNINRSVEFGFVRARYETRVIDFQEIYPVNIITKLTCGLLRKIGIDYFIRRYDAKINQEFVDIYNDFKPDIVLVIKGHKLTAQTLSAMKESKLFLWMMDSITRVPEIMKTIGLYDSVFVFEEDDIGFLSEKGISSELLPLALDHRMYYPLKSSTIKNDIVFIGSLYDNRIELIKKLVDMFPNRRVMAYGPMPSSGAYIRNVFLKMGKYRYNFSIGFVSPGKANSIIAESRIILNIHYNDSLSGCSLRFFEIAGTGKIQVVNRKYFLEREFDMDPLMFDDIDGILKIVEKILKNEILADEIALAAYENVVKNHTYYNRILKIFGPAEYSGAKGATG